jgi:hypothetical protein
VVGYPIGGDTMSVTSGVVSRIEVTSYVHGAAELLGIQIDAAVSFFWGLGRAKWDGDCGPACLGGGQGWVKGDSRVPADGAAELPGIPIGSTQR